MITKEQHKYIIDEASAARDELLKAVEDIQAKYPEFRIYAQVNIKMPTGINPDQWDLKTNWGTLASFMYWGQRSLTGGLGLFDLWKKERPFSTVNSDILEILYSKLQESPIVD